MLSRYANLSFYINCYQFTDTSVVAKNGLQNALTLSLRGYSDNFFLALKKKKSRQKLMFSTFTLLCKVMESHGFAWGRIQSWIWRYGTRCLAVGHHCVPDQWERGTENFGCCPMPLCWCPPCYFGGNIHMAYQKVVQPAYLLLSSYFPRMRQDCLWASRCCLLLGVSWLACCSFFVLEARVSYHWNKMAFGISCFLLVEVV